MLIFFSRLLRTLHILNRPLTNGITYEQFLNGAFINAFDLTTAQEGVSNKVINSVRSGIDILYVTYAYEKTPILVLIFFVCFKIKKIQYLGL